MGTSFLSSQLIEAILGRKHAGLCNGYKNCQMPPNHHADHMCGAVVSQKCQHVLQCSIHLQLDTDLHDLRRCHGYNPRLREPRSSMSFYQFGGFMSPKSAQDATRAAISIDRAPSSLSCLCPKCSKPVTQPFASSTLSY